jgi:hypothetical protein
VVLSYILYPTQRSNLTLDRDTSAQTDCTAWKGSEVVEYSWVVIRIYKATWLIKKMPAFEYLMILFILSGSVYERPSLYFVEMGISILKRALDKYLIA